MTSVSVDSGSTTTPVIDSLGEKVRCQGVGRRRGLNCGGLGSIPAQSNEGSVKNHSINKVLLEGDVGVVNRNNLEMVNYLIRGRMQIQLDTLLMCDMTEFT